MTFNIQEYLDSLPENITELNLSNKNLTFIPDLTRFTNLTHLYCVNNQLTTLPMLPPTLIRLICYDNQLTCVSVLPSTLKDVRIHNNPLTSLPVLPSVLIILLCYNTRLIDLFDTNIYTTRRIILHSRKLSCFKHLYYSLRFKTRFRDWLYKMVREPQAQKRFHPNYLLTHLTEDADLDHVLENWK
jgi:Leucine-rich repeat (LRR) protein